MEKPTKLYLDGDMYNIYQLNIPNMGDIPKALNDQMTTSGKRSRQFAFGPRVFEFKLWLTTDDYYRLSRIWESETSSDYTYDLQIGDLNAMSYSVTFDSFNPQPLDAVEFRVLCDVSFKNWI